MRSLLTVLLFVAAATASAVTPVDVYDFPSPELEARYRALIDEFRCPKCLNTNLSGSDAPIAADLRRTVRHLLVDEGLSDQEIRDYLQERYGDFVLYDPPLRAGTLALWLAPVAFLVIAIWVIWRMVRSARGQTHLSVEDQARIRQIVERQDSA